MLATLAEVAFIYQLSHVLRLLNVDRVGWVDAFSWLMVMLVVVSQVFVWSAILTGRLALYFWEELGWTMLVAANAVASADLYATRHARGDAAVLIHMNLLFALVYLAWQVPNLKLQIADARRAGESLQPLARVSWKMLAEGLRRSARGPDDAGHGVGRSRRTPVDDGILRDVAAHVGESDVFAVKRAVSDRGSVAHRTRRTSTSSGAGPGDRERRPRGNLAERDERGSGRGATMHVQHHVQQRACRRGRALVTPRLRSSAA